MPGNSGQAGGEYVLFVRRACIGWHLAAGDKYVACVQAAIHDADWQRVMQLDPAQVGAFVADSDQFEKPAGDR